jgi:drug/metabolite transporter (DMT)-like permease
VTLLTAAAGGFGAACAWSVATLSIARAGKYASSMSLLAGVSLVGLPLAAILVVTAGGAASGLTDDLLWVAIGGAGNIAGLLLSYAALRRGQVGIVAPLVSMEGGAAALIAVLAGNSFDVRVAPAIAIMLAGVVLAASTPAEPPRTSSGRGGLALALAVMAAGVFGASLYALAQVGQRLDPVWAVLPPSAAGVALVGLPVAAAGRLRLPRPALPLVALAGVAEVAGFGSYAAGARSQIGIAAVFTSQTGTVSAVAAACLFEERLTRRQAAGVAVVICGVTALAIIEAIA